jgi:hypothetical protein
MRRVHGGIGIVLIALSLLVQLRDYWDLVPFVILLWTAIVRYCPVNAALRRPAL